MAPPPERLPNDPRLNTAGIEIGARVMIQPKRPPMMQIVFRAGDKEASVECVHVAVYAGPFESLPSDAELAQSSESHPIKLAPEEHFFALNSYVAGIAEVGIGAMFSAAREAGNLPVGFNSLMQQQVLKALSRVAPAVALDFCLWVIDDATEHPAPEFLTPMRNTLSALLTLGNNLPFEVLANLAGDKDPRIRTSVAEMEHAPPELLAHLARDDDLNVRKIVAQNEGTSPEILTCLAADDAEKVRRGVAGNGHTPPEVLAHLVMDKRGLVRVGEAVNEHTPPEILARLARDKDAGVRRGVAGNGHAPPEVLVRLATDEDEDVRESVAGNGKSPPETLVRLAGDEDAHVRERVACNKHAPVYKV